MQVDLGEENDFYYNESLGRWVERGKENEVRTISVWTISRDMCIAGSISLFLSREGQEEICMGVLFTINIIIRKQ